MRIVETNELEMVSGGVVEGPDGKGCTDTNGTTTQPKTGANTAKIEESILQ